MRFSRRSLAMGSEKVVAFDQQQTQKAPRARKTSARCCCCCCSDQSERKGMKEWIIVWPTARGKQHKLKFTDNHRPLMRSDDDQPTKSGSR